MKVFINDIPLLIMKSGERVLKNHYDLILEADDHFNSKMLVGHVLIKDADEILIDRIVRLMEVKKLRKLLTLTLITDKKSRIVQHLKDQFKIIHAAGGLVVKDGKVLMIYRLGRWDLPKGKLKKEEEKDLAALREVEEECNIKVALTDKLTSTWHSYAFKGKKILKKTTWYIMSSLDDSQMKPQIEEDIEDLRYMTPEEMYDILPQTYGSIAYVIKYYLQHARSRTE